MVKSFISTNILLQFLAVTGVKTTSMFYFFNRESNVSCTTDQFITESTQKNKKQLKAIPRLTNLMYHIWHQGFILYTMIAIAVLDWLHSSHRDMIATGCEDKNVRVYYLATSSDQPLKVFTGHLAKVFHVRWSPLREGILCSGSDDGWV